MISEQFNANGIFWRVVIEFVDNEFLFYRENDTYPFYYFDSMYYDADHMRNKNWFTEKMHNFITDCIK